MAFDIVKLYISLLSEHFTLSDKAVVGPTANGIPPFVPISSNCVTTSWFVSKVLSEMQECVNDVITAELSGEASSGLQNLLESARWRFVDAMCDNWLRGANRDLVFSLLYLIPPSDSQRFHHLETWERDPKNDPFTLFLSQLQQFQTYATTSVYKIAGGIDVSDSRVPTKQLPIGRDFSSKIQRAFLDSLYALLDGLELLSRVDYEPVMSKETAQSVATSTASGVLLPSDHVRLCQTSHPFRTTDISLGFSDAVSHFDLRQNEQEHHPCYGQSIGICSERFYLS